jgi:hypothetical protein
MNTDIEVLERLSRSSDLLCTETRMQLQSIAQLMDEIIDGKRR